jgi:pilus assembly protein Flp/PilA
VLQYLNAYVNARRDEEGQGLVEYALIIFLVAVVCVAAVTLLGTTVAAVFTSITGSLG